MDRINVHGVLETTQLNSFDNFLAYSKRLGNLGSSLKNMRESMTDLLNSESSSGALYILDQHRESITELERFDKEAFSELLILREKLLASATESAMAFPVEFPKRIEALGIEFCEGTLHPLYLFDERFIELRFNAKSLTSQIKIRGGRELIVGIEVTTVVNAIQGHLARLHGRKLEMDELMNRVSNVFRSIQLGSKNIDSTSIKIKDFMKAYQKAYKCPIDEAIIDLSAAYRQFSNIKLDYIKDHEQGYLLYGFEERGYFGFMTLED